MEIRVEETAAVVVLTIDNQAHERHVARDDGRAGATVDALGRALSVHRTHRRRHASPPAPT
jgi:hypothetical protein